MTPHDSETKKPEPGLPEKLAIDRTVMALDRTLLAWVRTSLTFITFGFTIYHALQFVHLKHGVHLLRPQSPRNIGLLLECLGTFSLLLMMIDYIRMKRVLQTVYPSMLLLNPHFLSASVVLVLGLFLILSLLFNWSLL